MRPPGGKVRPEGAMPPGQRKAGPPLSTGSPMMQSSEMALNSSNPCVLGWKRGTAPKSVGFDGWTGSGQDVKTRPSPWSGTSTRGLRPSLERMTSVAGDQPASVGEKEILICVLEPG